MPRKKEGLRGVVVYLSESAHKRARVLAAEKNLSLSGLLGEIAEQRFGKAPKKDATK